MAWAMVALLIATLRARVPAFNVAPHDLADCRVDEYRDGGAGAASGDPKASRNRSRCMISQSRKTFPTGFMIWDRMPAG